MKTIKKIQFVSFLSFSALLSTSSIIKASQNNESAFSEEYCQDIAKCISKKAYEKLSTYYDHLMLAHAYPSFAAHLKALFEALDKHNLVLPECILKMLLEFTPSEEAFPLCKLYLLNLTEEDIPQNYLHVTQADKKIKLFFDKNLDAYYFHTNKHLPFTYYVKKDRSMRSIKVKKGLLPFAAWYADQFIEDERDTEKTYEFGVCEFEFVYTKAVCKSTGKRISENRIKINHKLKKEDEEPLKKAYYFFQQSAPSIVKKDTSEKGMRIYNFISPSFGVSGEKSSGSHPRIVQNSSLHPILTDSGGLLIGSVQEISLYDALVKQTSILLPALLSCIK